MGRGKAWSREESEAVAKAWKDVSSRTISQKDVNSKQFTIDLYQRFLELAPSDQATVDKRWKSRSQMALKTHFDFIAEEVVKFNATITKVVEQALNRPNEIREHTIIRAAIGIHAGIIQSPIDFDNVYSDKDDWKLFEAWKVLNTCPRYASKALVHFRQISIQKTESSDPPNGRATQPTSTDNENQSYMPSHNTHLQERATPMRTLASAALSMPLLTNLASMAALAEHSSPNGTNRQNNTDKITNTLKTQPDMEHRTSTLGKRQLPPQPNDQDISRKEPKTSSVEMLANGTRALELVAEALAGFGDALSEYNALTLFSRPEMQGRPDQKIFFDALAEKHALKAKIDRDKLVQQVEPRDNPSLPNSFPE